MEPWLVGEQYTMLNNLPTYLQWTVYHKNVVVLNSIRLHISDLQKRFDITYPIVSPDVWSNLTHRPAYV